MPTQDEKVAPDVPGADYGDVPEGDGTMDQVTEDAGPLGPVEEAPPPRDVFVFVEKLPVATYKPQPDYPSMAKALGDQGIVMVRVLVGKDGHVRDAYVVNQRSLTLDDAALDAAKRWVFEPATNNGNPVMVWVAIPFKFSLHD